MLTAFINFFLVAAVVYFLVVLPYNRLRKRGEVEQAQDTELAILTEIRDLLASNGQGAGRHGTVTGAGHRPESGHREDDERRQDLATDEVSPRPIGRGLILCLTAVSSCSTVRRRW